MLIDSLFATNFRKYHKLEITDIPEKGIITIEGLNESGKTSIGEAICFALFGRTFSLDDKNLHKIICWGHDTAEVTLHFSVGSYEHYKLFRSLDKDGNHKVRLSKNLGKNIPDNTNITLKTEEKVSEALATILNFDYYAFTNSFYLAQRELTSPDPHSDVIKQMAGISDYAGVSENIKKTAETHKQKITKLIPDVETSEKALDAVGIDETWLPELVDAELTLGEEQQHREALMGHLDRNEEDYTDKIKSFHSIRRSRSFWSILSILSFPIAIISWILWGAYQAKPEFYKEVAMNAFGIDKLPQIMNDTSDYLLPVAIISSLLFIIALVLKNKAGNNLTLLHKKATEISRSMREGHRYITTNIETLLPERVVQLFHERNTEESTLLIIPPREEFTNLSQLT